MASIKKISRKREDSQAKAWMPLFFIRNTRGLLGFVPSSQNSRFFAPNTILEGDIRTKTTDRPFRIIAMARKEITAQEYKDLCYLAAGVDEQAIADYIADLCLPRKSIRI